VPGPEERAMIPNKTSETIARVESQLENATITDNLMVSIGCADLKALLTLAEQASEQEEAWLYLHKWVERGLFDDKISMDEALKCIAHHPSAPWKNGRWNVDHKPYAKAFYAAFPRAAAQPPQEPPRPKLGIRA
jgi:hypothetical protein